MFGFLFLVVAMLWLGVLPLSAGAAETINIVLKNHQITSDRSTVDHGDFLSICSRDDDFHQPYSLSPVNSFGSAKAKEKEMLSKDNCRIVKVKNKTGGVIDIKIQDRFNPQALLVLQIRPKPRPTPKTSSKKGDHLFYAPSHQGSRVAFCYTSTGECGEKPANAWCRQKGYGKAVKWEIYSKSQDRTLKARYLGSGQDCPRGGCDTFRSITCR